VSDNRPAGRFELACRPSGPIALLKSCFPRWTIASSVPAAGRSADWMRAIVRYKVGSSPEMSTTAMSRETKSIT
jgi:hypothetical protein